MSMFDTIEDVQVKCFYQPFIVTTGDIVTVDYLGGNGTIIKKGYPVPTKTDYYDYGENVIILAEKAVIIKDYKVYEILQVEELTDTDFKDTTVINKFGDYLNIRNTNDLKGYLKEPKSYILQKTKLQKFADFIEAYYYIYTQRKNFSRDKEAAKKNKLCLQYIKEQLVIEPHLLEMLLVGIPSENTQIYKEYFTYIKGNINE